MRGKFVFNSFPKPNADLCYFIFAANSIIDCSRLHISYFFCIYNFYKFFFYEKLFLRNFPMNRKTRGKPKRIAVNIQGRVLDNLFSRKIYASFCCDNCLNLKEFPSEFSTSIY